MKVGMKHLKLAAVTAAALVALYFVGSYLTGGFGTVQPVPGPGQHDAFAKCLAQKGATMYGLKTCSHCADQKAMFGNSFQYVTYVECSEQQAICSAKGVTSVPSWEINGKIEVGVKPLADLSTETGCPLS